MRKLATACGATVAFFAAPLAFAGTFDASGQLVFDPNALLVESFEGEMSTMSTTVKTDSQALDGQSYAVVNPSSYVNLGVDPPTADTAMVARLFANGPGAIASFAVVYQDGAIGPHYQFVNLYPTGVMTSDGWYEMVSAPLQVQVAGQPALQIIVQTEGSDDTLIDAVEVDLGGTFAAPKTCATIADCTGDLQCRTGICVGDGEVPPLPTAAERAGLQELFTSDLRYHFGGEFTRETNLPNALAALEGMTTATTATGFWRKLTMAIHALRDSHSSIYAGDFGGEMATTCFAAGNADASTTTAPSDGTFPDVLTIYGDGAILKPGDRLVAVDGKHPVQFVRDLSGYLRGNTYATDPLTYTGAVEHLNDAIADYATTLTVVHCDATGVCGAKEDIPASSLKRDLYDPPTCDHRPAYHLAANNPDKSHYLGDNIYSGLLADSNATEGLYGMIFDSLYQDFSAPDPYKPVLQTFRTNAKGVVIDHRTGNGGYTFYATEVTGPFLTRTPISADVSSEQLIWLPMPISQDTGLTLFKANDNQGGGAYSVGSKTPTPGLKAAILMARDTSASDYLTLGFGMTAAAQPNVRTFGSQSDGAFSTIFDFSYGGSISYSFGSWDTALVDGTLRLGHSAQPDEPILPKQSDLAQGKDTAYLRALEWLRTCTDCGG